MRMVFADAQFFIALLHDKDQSHSVALTNSQALAGVPLVTTEEVLTEVLAFFAERGRQLRGLVAAYVDDLMADPKSSSSNSRINRS